MALNNTTDAGSCRLLEWDSKHWGFPVAIFEPQQSPSLCWEQAQRWGQARSIRCLYFAAKNSCRETIRFTREAGFLFVDGRLELEWSPGDHHPTPTGSKEIRSARDTDLSLLEVLARQAHQNTRFFKDPEFDVEKAAELYVQWIRRDFQENHVLVSPGRRPGTLGGYLSLAIPSPGRARIGLVAVDPGSVRQGLGRELVSTGLAWLAAQQVTSVRVSTQVANVAAIRMYEQVGFRVVENREWFHRWFQL